MNLIRNSIFLALAISLTSLPAKDGPADHPAAAIVKNYLEAVVKQDWKTAGEMLLPSSLERRKDQMIGAIKNSSTMTEEAAKLNMLGVKDVKELEALSPQAAYIVDRKAVHERMKIPDEALKRKVETLKINILGLSQEEDGKIIHAVVRTKQETMDTLIEELLLISLIQDKENAKKWFIVPDMQQPLTTPLKPQEPAPKATK
ncbi:MAG: hypothetical protein WCN98_01100 [Verrucomicrobiaceae bacterium]